MDDNRLTRAEWLVLSIAALTFVGLSYAGITRYPLPWWDEGWTLSVARNWVTLGHYGHVLNGVPTGPTLSAHLPVVAIVAASFKAFGVGLAQARMAIVVCSALTLILFYILTRTLYSRRTGVLAVVLVTLLPMQWDLSVILMGRNVLGEVPSLLFVLLGVLLLLRSGGAHTGWLASAALVLGVGLATKAQVMPFLLFGIGVVTVQLLIHDRQSAVRIVGVLVLAVMTMYGLGWVRRMYLATPGSPADPIVGLADVTAVVFDPGIRLETLRFAVFSGLSLTLALAYQLVHVGQNFRPSLPLPWKEAMRSVLALMAASWYGWYVLLSIGWGRYGFPAFVLASPFVADLLLRLVAMARGRGSMEDRSNVVPLIRLAAVGALVFFALVAGRQVWYGFRALGQPMPESGLEAVTDYLNRSTTPTTTIETYDSEVLFMLDRSVHVPPAQINVEFVRRNYLKGTTTLGYDLEQVHADFLLVGTFSRGFYGPLIQRGHYIPDRQFGNYELYRLALDGR